MPTDAVPPDTRSIDEMPFGDGATDREATAVWVRETLKRCGVSVAHEIETLGCTGAIAKGLSLDDVQKLRLGLGGGGVGLPCFVSPSRFCLAHNTIGGLQEQQKQLYPETAESISRPLKPNERGHIEMVEASRRVRGSNLDERLMKTADALRGRELPPGVETAEDEKDATESFAQASPTLMPVPNIGSSAFTCPEHRSTVWSCRYCVAQAVVEGSLEPTFAIATESADWKTDGLAPAKLESALDQLDKEGLARVDIYVQVARMERKLTRSR
jgi:hypothetical protein